MDGGITFLGRLTAFFTGLRAHYIVLVAAIAFLLLWPRRRQWKNQASLRAGTFLAALFFSLLLIHGLVTLGLNACAYCYLAFFSNVALLLAVVSFSSLNKEPSVPRQISIVLVLLLISFGLGFITRDDFSNWLFNLKVPRIHQGIHLGEWVNLWGYIGNLLHIDYNLAWKLFPPLLGLLGGIILLLLVILIQRIWRKKGWQIVSFGTLALMVFWMIGFVISPLMNGDYRDEESCSKDVIQNYENLGGELANHILPGSKVYWLVRSAVPLLYVPDIKIHPAQIYGPFAYLQGGNKDQVAASGDR